MRRLLLVALAPFAVATVVGLVVLWPRSRFQPTGNLGPPAQLVNGTVTAVTAGTCQNGDACDTVAVKVTSGPDNGRSATLPDVELGPGSPTLSSGERIVLGRTVDPTDQHVDYYFADFQRRTPLVLLALAFAVVVVGVARWRGLAAIAGLGFTWLVLLSFVIPAILLGHSPVAVTLVGGAAIMFVVLYLAHGFNVRTTTALLGTLASLALTGGLAAVSVAAAHLSGLGSDEATTLQTVAGNISLSGLILGGIVIGSLGVLNDVTVTQASATWELHRSRPDRTPLQLYRSAMRIGRDHIASTVYTLVLAYAGASLPLLLLFTVAGQRASTVLTGDVVAEEIVRTLVGSIGLVASVPLTSVVAAFVASRAGPPAGAMLPE